jgi:hypothetical protein
MRQLFFKLLLFLFVFAGCSSNMGRVQHPVLSNPQLADLTGQETVALVHDFGESDTIHGAFCSAVWVGHKTILTAAHCVRGYAEMKRKIMILNALVQDGYPPELAMMLMQLGAFDQPPDEDSPPIMKHIWEIVQSIPPVNKMTMDIPYIVQQEVVDIGVAPTAIHHSKVLALNESVDLALLEAQGIVPSPDHPVAHLADSTPVVGDAVSVMGHNNGNFWLFRQGIVSAYRHSMAAEDVDIQGPFIQISASVGPGDSGSGVFDAHGDLVGLNSFINIEIQGAYCIHLETIRGFLAGQHMVTLKIDPNVPDPPVK